MQAACCSTSGRAWAGHLAQQRGDSPLQLKLLYGQCSVEATPPVNAEGAIIQLPKVHLRARPVTTNGCVDVAHYRSHHLASEGARAQHALLPGAPSAPDGAKRCHTKARPQSHGASILGSVRPACRVIRQQQAGQSRGRRLLCQVCPRVAQPADDRRHRGAVEEGVGKGLGGTPFQAPWGLATRVHLNRAPGEPPSMSEEGPAP